MSTYESSKVKRKPKSMSITVAKVEEVDFLSRKTLTLLFKNLILTQQDVQITTTWR
jgi:hypothetical protein